MLLEKVLKICQDLNLDQAVLTRWMKVQEGGSSGEPGSHSNLRTRAGLCRRVRPLCVKNPSECLLLLGWVGRKKMEASLALIARDSIVSHNKRGAYFIIWWKQDKRLVVLITEEQFGIYPSVTLRVDHKIIHQITSFISTECRLDWWAGWWEHPAVVFSQQGLNWSGWWGNE